MEGVVEQWYLLSRIDNPIQLAFFVLVGDGACGEYDPVCHTSPKKLAFPLLSLSNLKCSRMRQLNWAGEKGMNSLFSPVKEKRRMQIALKDRLISETELPPNLLRFGKIGLLSGVQQQIGFKKYLER